ncbi:hypothetical protein BDN70DRAFT_902138 [Pholiota conissans]|uniref:Uncharacterized protein n=1 Tax=Pholiota conissans TaxID=109636 RepID=A0A9P5YI96_9AGAR|nr:hypothetical protein BDN70DRAFT_902138 [Pholiota conissans]
MALIISITVICRSENLFQALLIKHLLYNLGDPAGLCSDPHGFQYLRGFCRRVWRVRVRVKHFKPSLNPYPWEGVCGRYFGAHEHSYNIVRVRRKMKVHGQEGWREKCMSRWCPMCGDVASATLHGEAQTEAGVEERWQQGASQVAGRRTRLVVMTWRVHGRAVHLRGLNVDGAVAQLVVGQTRVVILKIAGKGKGGWCGGKREKANRGTQLMEQSITPVACKAYSCALLKIIMEKKKNKGKATHRAEDRSCNLRQTNDEHSLDAINASSNSTASLSGIIVQPITQAVAPLHLSGPRIEIPDNAEAEGSDSVKSQSQNRALFSVAGPPQDTLQPRRRRTKDPDPAFLQRINNSHSRFRNSVPGSQSSSYGTSGASGPPSSNAHSGAPSSTSSARKAQPGAPTTAVPSLLPLQGIYTQQFQPSSPSAGPSIRINQTLSSLASGKRLFL